MPTARNRPNDFVARHAAPHHADPGNTRTPMIVTVVLLSLTAAAAIGLRAGSSAAPTAAPAAFESASATPLNYAPQAGDDDAFIGDDASTAEATSGSPSSSAAAATTTVPATTLAANGIPTVALQAYQLAAAQYNKVDPGCRLPWTLLAAIGRVESDHGRFGGAVLRTDGTSTPPVIGPALDGKATALVAATPTGITLDGDRQYDHAVGPMQIIPSTWTRYALAATGNSGASPFNIFDATATAARYLCVAGGDMGTSAGQLRAVFAYNHSNAYVSTVLTLEYAYDSSFSVAGAGQVGAVVPRVTTQTAVTTASVPPANPGAPTAVAPVVTSTDSPTSSPSPSASSSGAPTSSSSSAPVISATSPPVTPSTDAPTPPASSTPSTPSASTAPTSPASSPSIPTSSAPPASSSSSPTSAPPTSTSPPSAASAAPTPASTPASS